MIVIEFITVLAVFFLWGKFFDMVETHGIWPVAILFLALNYVWSLFHNGDIIFAWYFIFGPIIFDIVVWCLCAVGGIIKTLTSKEK